MAKQFGIIFACLAIGELLAMIPWLNIPGSIWGMIVLTVLLEKKVVKPESVATTCKFLVSNMAFFFIPPGVALMYYFDLISKEWLPITAATFLSMTIVLLVTGQLHQWIHSKYKQHNHKTISARDGKDK